MLKKILKRALVNMGIKGKLQDVKNLMIKSQTAIMSPVERHIYLNTIFDENIFGSHYLKWTMKRINKVIELYGLDFFKNKRILELGGGREYRRVFCRDWC